MPDGTIPPIGDSEEKRVSLDLAKQIAPEEFEKENLGMRVFSDGYAIWRTENTHMTMKSIQTGRFLGMMMIVASLYGTTAII